MASSIIGGAEAPPAGARRETVGDDADGQRLDNFLLRRLKGVPKTHVYRVIRSGEVRVDGGRAHADSKLVAGQVVRIPPMRVAAPAGGGDAATSAPPRAFATLLDDDAMLAIDKPAGVAVHGGSGVAFGVIEQLRRARPEARFLELVHRLDRETSGVLLLAKSRRALLMLQAQFRERGTDKRYLALVRGAWPASRRVVDRALVKTLDARGERHVRVARDGDAADAAAAQRAISTVAVLARTPDGAAAPHTLVEVGLKTGRTHQIRVHLAAAGHPIAGDPRYGDFDANRADARGAAGLARMFLHAWRIDFDHPAGGRRRLVAPLPPECAARLDALGIAQPPEPQRAPDLRRSPP